MGDFSRELCGGTHLDHVGEVGLVKLVGEESVSAGTRRISALTGKAALEFVRQEEEILGQLAGTLKVPPAQLADRVAALIEEVKTLKKQAGQRKATAKTSPDDLLAAAQPLGDAKLIVAALEDSNPDEMRQLADVLRRKVATGLAVLLITAVEGKVQLVAALTPDLNDRGLHAGNWLKAVAPVVGGGGGGRPDLAQAGGKDPSKIEQALETAREFLRSKL
jgi:alanyl-tRNA synthetase